MSDAVVATLVGLFAVVAIVGVGLMAVIALILWKLRAPVSAFAAALGSIAYVIMPFDAIPEFPLGPIGYSDDISVFVIGMIYAGLMTAKRRRDSLPSRGGNRALR